MDKKIKSNRAPPSTAGGSKAQRTMVQPATKLVREKKESAVGSSTRPPPSAGSARTKSSRNATSNISAGGSKMPVSTKIQQNVVSSSRRQPSSSASPVTQAPKSMYATVHDQTMATRQDEFKKLTEAEKLVQDEWAQQQITNSGACITGYRFSRVANGYRCVGGNETHFIPDSSLVKGDKSFYGRTDHVLQWPECEPEIIESDGWWWIGPCYATPEQLRLGREYKKENDDLIEEGRKAGRDVKRKSQAEKGPGHPKPSVEQVRRRYDELEAKHGRGRPSFWRRMKRSLF